MFKKLVTGKRSVNFIVLFIMAFSFSNFSYEKENANEYLRRKVEELFAGLDVYVGTEKIHCSYTLPKYYQKNEFNLAWNDTKKNELLNVIKKAGDEGLNPFDYHLGVIEKYSTTPSSEIEKAEFDLILTDAFLLYASHFLNGKVNPETVDSEWKAIRREGNALEILEKALEQGDIKKALLDLEPQHPGYSKLKKALTKYQNLLDDGGWKTVPEGETLKPGMVDSIRVPLIIDRLQVTGDLKKIPQSKSMFTEELSESVKMYQKRNGLEVDGNIGKATTLSFNVSAAERVNQIKVNLERFRWINQHLGDHYIMVNIADYHLEIFNKDSLTFSEKVIVGKPFRKTPVFSGKMTYFVLNPTWTVPPTILFKDMLPEVKKDYNYLITKNIKVIQGQGSNAVIVDPSTVDWSSLSVNKFPYTLRQDPGPLNALGQVKFMFPNPYNVYIHDTPSRELFARSDRAFSSGCIRLNKPLSLVNYLIKDDKRWNSAKIQSILKEGKETSIILSNPVNVHILYLTAWVIDDAVQFRNDLYERDLPVLQAITQNPPAI